MKNYRSRVAWFSLCAGIAVVYFVTGRLCVVISALVANVSWMLFIPAGLSLTAALLWGRRIWPAVFVGEFALGIASAQPVTASFLMGIGNGLDAALAGWWFHDRLGRRVEFDRLRDVVRLIVAELFVLQPISLVFGMLAVLSSGHDSWREIETAGTAWYAADIYAECMAAPLALAWLRWKVPAAGAAKALELAGLGALTALVGAIGPGRWALPGLPLPLALILVFPLLVWASIRFVPPVAISVGTVLGLFALDAVLAGAGLFRNLGVGQRMVYANVFMGVSLGTGLLLAAAMADERRFESEQARLIAELQAALAQIKRLEEIVTLCAWTGKVRWRESWVSVETFLHERYNVSITHGISDEAMRRVIEGESLERPGGPPPPGHRPPAP